MLSNNDFSPVSSVLACCGLFAAAGLIYSHLTRSKYITYAEANDFVVNLDSKFDSLVFALYQKADYSQCEFAKYNPPFECESEVFNLPENSNHKFIGTMLQRNAFLLSRLFIKNSNFTPTSGKTKFLDIGCGIALDLPGIYACSGGEDNVDYLGVDIDSAMISQNQHIYRNYINTKFIAENAVKVLTSPENKHKFDVILVQHPNICTWHSSEGFKNIFKHIIEALAPGGKIYITFYYDYEVDYFNKNILPSLNEKIPFHAITKNNRYYHSLVYNYEGRQVKYTPEQFSLQSFPRPALINTPSVTRFGNR